MKKSFLVEALSVLALLTTISAYDLSPVYACHEGVPHSTGGTCGGTGTGGGGGSTTNTVTQTTGDITSTGGSATNNECRNRCSATGGSTGDITASPSVDIG
jgi:hypothetical protein